MGLIVLDRSCKLRMNLSGGTLPDPVTVPHGGLGLTNVAAGDILYGSAANVFSRLAVDNGGTRLVTNQGTSGNPTHSDPSALSIPGLIPLNRQWGGICWANAQTSTTPQVTWNSSTQDIDVAVFVQDATSTWRRFSTSANGSVSGYRTTPMCWLDHNPTLRIKIRTGASVAAVRYWIIFNNNAGAFLSNSDNQAALKGFGLRFSTAAGDAGWVPWTSDGTTQTIGGSILAVAASTVYTITMKLTGTAIAYTINASTGTATLPAGAQGASMRFNAEVMALAASQKILDVTAIYAEWS
jgi:hypothetical protein